MSAPTQRARWLVRLDASAAAALALDLIAEASLARGVPDRLATVLFALAFAPPVAVRHPPANRDVPTPAPPRSRAAPNARPTVGA